MIKCDNCGNKMGYFKSKYDYKDRDGNSIIYCENCNSKHLKNENKKRKEKIKPILKKYISKLDFDNQLAIFRLHSENDYSSLLEKNSLIEIREKLDLDYNNIKTSLTISQNYEELEDLESLKKICKLSNNFLDDLEKIQKLLKKKEFIVIMMN